MLLVSLASAASLLDRCPSPGTPGSVATVCAGTGGVASLERESWDRVDQGAASLDTGSLYSTAWAPGALGWS